MPASCPWLLPALWIHEWDSSPTVFVGMVLQPILAGNSLGVTNITSSRKLPPSGAADLSPGGRETVMGLAPPVLGFSFVVFLLEDKLPRLGPPLFKQSPDFSTAFWADWHGLAESVGSSSYPWTSFKSRVPRLLPLTRLPSPYLVLGALSCPPPS